MKFYDFLVVCHHDDFENYYVEHKYDVDCSTCNGFCRPKEKEKPNNDSKRKRSFPNPNEDMAKISLKSTNYMELGNFPPVYDFSKRRSFPENEPISKPK